MATHHDVATWQVLHDQVEKLIILQPQRYFSAGCRLQHLRLAMQVLTLRRAAAGPRGVATRAQISRSDSMCAHAGPHKQLQARMAGSSPTGVFLRDE